MRDAKDRHGRCSGSGVSRPGETGAFSQWLGIEWVVIAGLSTILGLGNGTMGTGFSMGMKE